MNAYSKVWLLFTLNVIDAVLTLIWVRNNYAPEGNRLMAYFLEMGDLPFLAVKIFIGAFAAYSFYRWRHFWLAKVGSTFALIVYIALMGIHFMTALTVFGFRAELAFNFLRSVSDKLLFAIF